jgi:hypothetical protein
MLSLPCSYTGRGTLGKCTETALLVLPTTIPQTYLSRTPALPQLYLLGKEWVMLRYSRTVTELRVNKALTEQ